MQEPIHAGEILDRQRFHDWSAFSAAVGHCVKAGLIQPAPKKRMGRPPKARSNLKFQIGN